MDQWHYGAGRSFAMVIQQLPVELRDATCVFYLILRALDTVEDDMAIPKEVKIPMLRTFHEHLSDRYGGLYPKKLRLGIACLLHYVVRALSPHFLYDRKGGAH